MFDFVHERKRLVQIVLALIVLPFAFFGIDTYRKSGSVEALAEVDGEKVTQQEFDKVLQDQQERVRQMAGGQVDPAMFDRPEVKQSILDGLVNQKLLQSQAQKARLWVDDEQLREMIAGIEAFQKDGKFDQQQYESVLARQNMSPLLFEARVRQELGARNLTQPYAQGGYASATVADRLIRLSEQERMVSLVQISQANFTSQVKVDDAAVKGYYDQHQAEFKVSEQARVEYLAFNAGVLQSQVSVTDDEIKQYYDEHQSEFGLPEQRQAAHILITTSGDEAAQKAARAKAEQVLDEVKKSPGKFAELAKKYSQDPGSASAGGDLGYFGRGQMVKPFEDAVYSLKAGEISGLVQSDFGFHIIKLIGVKGGKIATLAEARNPIEHKLRLQKAGDKFAELAEKFSNLVYEQSDSLKSAAELVKIPVQQSPWLVKGQPDGGVLWTDKVLQAVFSDDVLKNKRNTAAIEIAENTLLAARLLEHKDASVRPLADVSAMIRQKLVAEQARDLAIKQGKDALAQLQRGEMPAVAWTPVQSVTRNRHPGVEGELAEQLFKAPADKLPAYFGAATPQGFALLRLDAVKEVGDIDEMKRARFQQQLRQFTGDALMQAYLAEVRKKADITTKPLVAAETK